MPHGDDLSVAITHGGTIRLRAAALGPAADAQRSRFLCRALACRDVEAIDVDTAAGEAVLQLADPAATGRDTAASLMELAEAIRGKRTALDPASLPADCLRRGRVSVRRYAGRLSTWLVEPSRPGLIRLAHAELRRDRALARGVERVLVTMPGVRQVSIGRWRGEIVVRHDPGGFDADAMLAILQHMVDARSSMPVVSTRGTMVRSSATLGLAAVTDLVIPGLAPLTSLVLVANNLRTVSRAAGDTLARRVGMPTVMTAILVGTLATGQFLAAGIMAWSYDFWRRRHRRDIEAERRLLLEDAAPLPECSSLLDDAGGLQVAPVAVSRRGSRLEVVAPQMVPLDGRVIGGEAIVDARLPTGRFGVRHASPGDTVFAGTILLEGSLLVEADRDADASRIVGIARAIGAATRVLPGRQAPTVTAERFAEEFAGPTLATAALGLFAGDVNTAVAVMRPDYANAEAVSVSLSDLDAISSAIERGCLLKSAGMLDRLASVDCLLVIDHPRLWRRRLEVSGLQCPAGDADEAVRWAASLARHLADDRAMAAAREAQRRGVPLVDLTPQSYGEGGRLAITASQRGRRLLLREQPASSPDRPDDLLLEIEGRLAARLAFAEGPQLRESEAFDALAEAAERVGRGSLETVLLSSLDAAVLAERAAALHASGGEQLAAGDLDEAVAAAIRQRSRGGSRVAIVGPLDGLPVSCAAADVAIDCGLTDKPWGPACDVDAVQAGIVSLSGELGVVAELLLAADSRQRRLARSRKISLVPNIACVAGAFFLGFTSLVVAVVSNLGTLGSYTVSTASLHATRRSLWMRNRGGPLVTPGLSRPATAAVQHAPAHSAEPNHA